MGLLFAMPGNEALAAAMTQASSWTAARLEIRRFPDNESYVRIEEEVAGQATAILCTLARPDDRFLQLAFASRLLRDLGAASVTLVAPYLPYLRQDRRFKPGEAVTSLYFAALISQSFDRLVTVEPHLHRYRELREIYTIPTIALKTAPLLAEWIGRDVSNPLLVGPDEESKPWVSVIAEATGAPFVVLKKRRSGDRSVSISGPDLSCWRGRQPVIIDDIAASGATLIEAAALLRAAGLLPPVCLVVHALFAPEVARRLSAVMSHLVSTNSVIHPSNGIDITGLLAAALS